MNRLTTRVADNVYYSKGEYAPTTLCAEMETWEVRECMTKLAAYEDTGLEPEDVSTLLKENVVMIQNGNNNTHINHVSTLNL